MCELDLTCMSRKNMEYLLNPSKSPPPLSRCFLPLFNFEVLIPYIIGSIYLNVGRKPFYIKTYV